MFNLFVKVKSKRFMDSRQKIEKVFELYLKPPFKNKLDINKLREKDTIVLNTIVMNEIVPEVFNYLRQEKKEEKKRQYIHELTEALIDAGYCTFTKKKQSYKSLLKEIMNPVQKTDEEYFKEHQLYLKRTLVKQSEDKIDKI